MDRAWLSLATDFVVVTRALSLIWTWSRMAEGMNLVCPFAAGWTLIKLWNNWEGWETYWA